MLDPVEEQRLVDRAVAGDQDALTQLLLAYYDPLCVYLKCKIPVDMRSTIAVEDVIQDAHVQVFRKVGTFKPAGEASFYRWLITIAKTRLLDRIKEHHRQKRGGDRKRVHAAQTSQTIHTLIAIVAQDSETPSRCVARQERQRYVQVGLAGLKEDYRVALKLRYLDGLPVAEIAQRMGRTEHAVHMLCNRGLKKLKEALDKSSTWIQTG